MERLKRLQATNLFGYLKQDISFAIDQGITILHGANGSGKTTLLKCLAEVSRGDWSTLFYKPFGKLTLSFESGNKFEIVKEGEDISTTFSYLRKGKESQVWRVTKEALQQLSDFGDRRWIHEGSARSSRRHASSQLDFDFFIHSNIWDIIKKVDPGIEPPPEWLREFGKNFHCTLIEEQRLIRFEHESEKNPKITRVVSEYSNLIVDTIKDVARQYGEKSQQLERTFPMRLVEALSQTPPEPMTLQQKYTHLDMHRNNLQTAGLIGSETSMMKLDQSGLSREDVRRLLSFYADDVTMKLALFDSIFRKITLFEELIRGYFSRKTVRISRSGIEINTEAGQKLDVTALSSGEQHIFVLFFRLIFVEPSDRHLVLIDEPELSLHPNWQIRFVDDLERIREISPIDFVLASHSPLIFQGHMDFGRDLNV